MQKARRHPNHSGLRPLVSAWFQGLFTPLLGVLFTFPSRYLFTIGLLVVFSLAGWCRLFQTGFLRSRPTQDPNLSNIIYVYGTLTLFRWPFQNHSTCYIFNSVGPTTPHVRKHTVWATPLSLATTHRITIVFSSSRYLDVSVPWVRLRLLGLLGCPIRTSTDH